jgi:hypothetical protein
VDLLVTDAMGTESTTPFELFVGDSAACQGAIELGCGSVWANAQLDPSVGEQLCLTTEVAESTFVTLVISVDPGGSMDVFSGLPGSTPDDAWDKWLLFPRGGLADAAILDENTSPMLEDYRDMPIFLNVTSNNGGGYELTVDCY